MRLLVRQVRAEQRVFWRNREASIFTFALPLVLLGFLGLVGRNRTVAGGTYASFIVPGMLGLAVVLTTFAGLAITLVIRRERGVLKRVRGTPLPPASYLGGLVGSNVVVLVLESAIVIVVGALALDVRIPGGAWEAILLVAGGAAMFATLGIALSSFIPTAEGASALVNAVYVPMLLLSGAFFPVSSLPAAVEWIAAALPLTHLLDALRSVYRDGGMSGDDLAGLLVPLAWAVAGALLAMRRFRWEPRVG